MWENESNKYWKEKKTKSFKKKVYENKSKIAIAAVVFLLLAAVGVVYYRRGSRKPVVLSDEPIRLFNISPNQRDKCVQDAGDNGNHAPHQCQKNCHKVRHSLPKPTSHRACTDGCKAGVNKAIEVGCGAAMTDNARCREEATPHCVETCKPMLQQFPRPALFELCRSNCVEALNDACDHAISTLRNVRDSGAGRPRTKRGTWRFVAGQSRLRGALFLELNEGRLQKAGALNTR
eukprot:FR735366.1.p1 GENE.FR735366.1~~FR735366.1.p1  ORF type:complete len:233 (+),score=18.55 FR735366.1:54-752(+)